MPWLPEHFNIPLIVQIFVSPLCAVFTLVTWSEFGLRGTSSGFWFGVKLEGVFTNCPVQQSSTRFCLAHLLKGTLFKFINQFVYYCGTLVCVAVLTMNILPSRCLLLICDVTKVTDRSDIRPRYRNYNTHSQLFVPLSVTALWVSSNKASVCARSWDL